MGGGHLVRSQRSSPASTPPRRLPAARPSCLDRVAAATLIADPTAREALTVELAGSATEDDGTPGRSALCTVTPTEREQLLTTTLRQLGTEPLPLS
jgi:hypothetical protein